MKLDLRQLRHVLALDRYRNFARAAEAIGLTQPALSRSIQSLEDELGARLFDRDRARVEPTALGLRLIELSRPIVTQASSAERELQQMVGLAGGLLRVGAGPFPAEISVGTAIGRLARLHPGIQADVAVGDWPDLCRRLLNDELDLVVAESSHAEGDDRLIVEPLPEHRGVLYGRAGHPLAERSDLTVEDVLRYPMVMTTLPKRMLDSLGKGASTARPGLPEGAAATEFRVETPFLARQIVMQSDVLSMALLRQIDSDVALGRLAVLHLHLPWLNTSYGMIRLSRRTPAPAATEFLKILREVEGEIAAEERGADGTAGSAGSGSA
jgi:DNA-binding transcriptional LysR family regulator